VALVAQESRTPNRWLDHRQPFLLEEALHRDVRW
jgi:hypothetical protein